MVINHITLAPVFLVLRLFLLLLCSPTRDYHSHKSCSIGSFSFVKSCQQVEPLSLANRNWCLVGSGAYRICISLFAENYAIWPVSIYVHLFPRHLLLEKMLACDWWLSNIKAHEKLSHLKKHCFILLFLSFSNFSRWMLRPNEKTNDCWRMGLGLVDGDRCATSLAGSDDPESNVRNGWNRSGCTTHSNWSSPM